MINARCACSGTGFVTGRGKYRSRITGTVHDGVDQAKRCPSYVAYFKGMDKPGMHPLSVGGRGDCEAAVAAHKEAIDRTRAALAAKGDASP